MKSKVFISLKVLIAILFVLNGCKDRSPTNVTLETVRSDPAKILSSYDFDSNSDLVDRIKPIPESLLSLWKKADKINTYTSYTPTADELSMIREYLSLLPPLHKAVLKQRLVGIYFMENCLGSGIADFILGDNDEVYVYTIFNPNTLQSSMSEWITYREKTCFAFNSNSSIQIAVNCGEEYTGFMYILLHEMTHAVDYVRNITPYVNTVMNQLNLASNKKSTDFIIDVWKSYDEPIARFNFDLRRDVTFYGLRGGPKLEDEKALSIYKDLSQTPFVSLFASMNWAEDLAELVTWYHYTEILKQPYEISVYQNNIMIQSYRPMDFPEVKGRITSITGIYK